MIFSEESFNKRSPVVWMTTQWPEGCWHVLWWAHRLLPPIWTWDSETGWVEAASTFTKEGKKSHCWINITFPFIDAESLRPRHWVVHELRTGDDTDEHFCKVREGREGERKRERERERERRGGRKERWDVAWLTDKKESILLAFISFFVQQTNTFLSVSCSFNLYCYLYLIIY